MVRQGKDEAARLMAVLSDVLGDSCQGDFSPIMQFLVDVFEADGAVVWEAGPEVDFTQPNPKGRLFVLAAKTPPTTNVIFGDLPIEGSKVGKCLLDREVKNVPDISQDDEVIRKYPALVEAKIKRMLAAPIDFPGGMKGVVSLYRIKERPPFSKETEEQLKQYVDAIPRFLRTVRDKLNYALIGEVSSVLESWGLSGRHNVSLEEEPGIVFAEICGLLAGAFHCLEATVVMQDVGSDSWLYRVIASSWQGEFSQRDYGGDPADGLTGWVLANGKPVRLLDLCNFERDKDNIRKKYPGLVCQVPFPLKEAIEEEVRKSPFRQSAQMPPLSFVAVPIMLDQECIGAVRCEAIRPRSGYVGPFFFCSHDEQVLTVVAGQLAQYWSSWLKRRQIQEENRTRDELVERITELHSVVVSESLSGTLRQAELFGEVLDLVARTIHGADALDVRLYDDTRNDLYIAYTWGERWKKGDPPGFPVRITLDMRFPIDDPPQSAGAYVYQNKVVYHIEDVGDRNAWPYYEAIFPDAKRMITAPIMVGDTAIGVLDIHGFGEKPLPPIAETAATLVGRQCGLYHQLTDSILDLNATQAKLQESVAAQEELIQTQSKAFEDVAHQLRSPLIQASARASASPFGKLGMPRRLQIVGTLVRKALRITTTMRVLGNLYRNERIPLRRQVLLRTRELVAMLKECASDNEFVIAPERNIRITVDIPSFADLKIDEYYIVIDADLIEQAVNCLLDNAVKYSFSNTEISVSGGYTSDHRFFVNVRNVGVRLREYEARLCVNRGWRGERAASVTGEGFGIGLWMADNIMKAHNGELVVVPTNTESQTDVKLVFPTKGV